MTNGLKSTTESMMQRLPINCHRTLLTVLVVCLLAANLMAHPGSGITVDRLGQVYFLDTGSGLWKIDTQGRLTKLSGLLNHWLALDANNGFAGGRLPTDPMGDWVITSVGVNPTLLISTDFPIAIGQEGNLYYPSGRPGHLQLMRATPSGVTSVVATLPLTVTGQPLPYIGGLIAGADGSLYYTEDTAIKRITPQGRIVNAAIVRARVGAPSIPG